MASKDYLRFHYENAADYAYDLSIYSDGIFCAKVMDDIAETQQQKSSLVEPATFSELREKLWTAIDDLDRSPLLQSNSLNVILYANYDRLEIVEDFNGDASLQKLRGMGEWFHKMLRKATKDLGYELRVYRDGFIEVEIKGQTAEGEQQQAATNEFMDRFWLDHKIDEAMSHFLLWKQGGFSHTIFWVTHEGRCKIVGYNDQASTKSLADIEDELRKLCNEETRDVEPQEFSPSA